MKKKDNNRQTGHLEIYNDFRTSQRVATTRLARATNPRNIELKDGDLS